MNETKLQKPSGWKLVPIEPTPKMIDATWLQDLGGLSHNKRNRKIYELMLAAAPAAPATWSSATAPGPDGMQHCIAVPGMPSAARDAALEEAAALTDSLHATISDIWEERAEAGHNVLTNVAEKIRAIKSIAGPVAGSVDVEFKRLADAILQATTNSARNEALRGMAELFDRATPAPVQQTAPSFDLAKAMRQAYNLGQTYWQQADSESWSQQDKSNATADKFAKLLAETVAAVTPPAQPVGLSGQDRLDAARLGAFILTDPDGGMMRVSSEIDIGADNAMKFIVTNPDTGARYGVALGFAELTPDAAIRAAGQKGGA